MLRGVEYFFYKSYVGIWRFGLDKTPQVTAFFEVAGVIALNGIALVRLAEIVSGRVFPDFATICYFVVGLTTLALYFFLMSGRRYRLIVDRYSNESPHNRIKGTIIKWSYEIGSLALLIVFALLPPQHHG
jgi:hypothetical protein